MISRQRGHGRVVWVLGVALFGLATTAAAARVPRTVLFEKFGYAE